MFHVKQQRTYRKWNIVDLFDYLTEYYSDMAQEDPALYGAVYTGENPSDYTDPEMVAYVTQWRNDHAKQVSGVWYWKDNANKIVSSFRVLCFMWRSDLKELHPETYKFCVNYIDANRNDYVISAGAFRQILKERYAEFCFLTSFDYDYKTEKRVYVDTLTKAGAKLMDTLRVWKHDKQDPLTKLMQALRASYDPISNYDRKEHTELEMKGIETDVYKPQGTVKVESEKQGKESSTFNKGAENRETYKTTYDSATALLTDSEKLVGTNGVAYEDTTDLEFTNRKDVSTTSFGTGQNERKDITTKTFGGSSESEKRKDVTDSYVHGNIGVTTSQQMVLSTFPVEVADKIEHYTVNEFVHEYLVR